jgi:DNA-binding transcriptional regulator LsrR (DeoR family)
VIITNWKDRAMMRDASPPAADRGILIEVAKLYYEQQLTQAEIGRQLNTSRSTVSRLLQEARDTGVVRINIDYSWARDNSLEQRLCQQFNLQDCRVLRSFDRPMEDVVEGMGQLAAEYLNGLLTDHMAVGVSYGRAMASTIRQFVPARRMEDMTVIQVIGALGSQNPLIEGTDLTRELANKLGGRYRYLHAPLMVEDSRTRDLLLQEPSVQDVLAAGRQVDVVLLGIGALASEASGLIWSGYLTRKDLAWLHNAGAVGHTCALFFDARGEPLDIDLNKRSISIGLQALRSIETVFAVAGTQQKAPAILGALRGGYIDVLVTDDQAARGVLDGADAMGIAHG